MNPIAIAHAASAMTLCCVYIFSHAFGEFVMLSCYDNMSEAEERKRLLEENGIRAWAIRQSKADVISTAEGLRDQINKFIAESQHA